MTLPNDTIATGAEPRCPDCQTMPKIAVHRSGAGFYVGTWCQCGPYSRVGLLPDPRGGGSGARKRRVPTTVDAGERKRPDGEASRRQLRTLRVRGRAQRPRTGRGHA